MNRSRAVLLASALVSAAACDGGAQAPWASAPPLEVDLRVSVAPLEVELLQPVTVTVDRFRSRDVEVTLDADFDASDWLEQARAVSPEAPFGDGFWQRTQVVLLPVRGPAELRIPALRAEAVAADGAAGAVATAEEVIVRVASALGEEHGAAIEAPGDPFETPGAWWPWAAAAVALAALAAAVMVGRRRGRTTLRAPVTVDLPAHVRALRELRRWRGAARRTPAEVEAFYVGVSHVLRVYLEERFGLRAPERTTEEFLRDLERGDGLARRHRDELERFLSQCDMVKFAKLVPSNDEHDRTFALAESFVESTRSDRGAAEEAPA